MISDGNNNDDNNTAENKNESNEGFFGGPVGRGNPPRSGMFSKDKPNPRRGRKKGQKNFRTDFMEEMQTKFEITEGGKKVKISKQRGLIKRIINGSLNGDPKATALTVSLMLDFSNSDDIKNNAKPLSEAEENVLRNYLKKQGGDNAE